MAKHTIPPARRRDPGRTDPHVGTRVETFVKDAELGPVAEILTAQRDEILRRWLEAARAQRFHAAQPDKAVADHIPHLFDALAAFLQRAAPRTLDPAAPLDDQAVHAAARAHAGERFEQGLGAADVATEFRLLRQEIGRALREHVVNTEADLVGAELLVHDALDGAVTLALAAWDAHEAERRHLTAEVARLGAERDRTAALLDQAHDAVLAWEFGGPIVYWNRGARELYGFAAEEALGQSSQALFGTPPEQLNALLEALDRDGRWAGEMEHSTRDGRRVWVESRQVVVREGEGSGQSRRYVLEANRDVTAHKAAEVEREVLLAVIAHDLKTPLTAIKFSADLLRLHAAAGRLDMARVVDRAAAISAAAAAMAAQIGELLDVARLRAGEQLELVRHPTDLVALAYQSAARVQGTTDRHTIDVEADVPALVGDWDAFRLERMLGNLLDNAVKYSPDGGEIVVELTRDEGWAILRVKDQGVGIAPADLSRIFERFQRGARTASRVPGEGLGLAGARQIVLQHGGTIAVESQEGVSTTFTVRLPLPDGA